MLKGLVGHGDDSDHVPDVVLLRNLHSSPQTAAVPCASSWLLWTSPISCAVLVAWSSKQPRRPSSLGHGGCITRTKHPHESGCLVTCHVVCFSEMAGLDRIGACTVMCSRNRSVHSLEER